MIKSNDVLTKINRVVENLDKTGVLDRLNGSCIAAAEIVQNLLHAEGINSRLQECTAIITQKEKFALVGYDNFLSGPGQVDTHMVVITQTEVPLLIDLSMGYIMNKPKLSIISPLVVSSDPEIITSHNIEDLIVTYRVKRNPRLYNVHQKTLVERLQTEAKLISDMSIMKKFIYVAIGFGLVNFIINMTLLTLKVIFP